MSDNIELDKEDGKLNLPPIEPLRQQRRNIRYRLFRIRDDADPVSDDLKQYFESQFQFGMTWRTFTFTWDVSPTNPLKIITDDMWDNEGGGYDVQTGVKSPPAFTHQA